MTDRAERAATPWWFWVVSVVGLLWSLGGAFDYVMTQTRNASYLATIPEALLAYFYAMPAWLVALWALAVWGGLLGWVLMLARSRFAGPAFLVSLVSMIVNFGYSVLDGGLALQAQYMGSAQAYGFTAAVIAAGVFALWLAGRMRGRGVLR